MATLQNGLQLVANNKKSVAAGVGLAAIGGASIYALSKYKNKKKSKKRRKTSKRSSRRIKRRPYTAGKRKDTSKRRIRFTKRGQPYIITAKGKARFIKMSSVKNSRKRKGGRY
jgi:hypothetical protein